MVEFPFPRSLFPPQNLILKQNWKNTKKNRKCNQGPQNLVFSQKLEKFTICLRFFYDFRREPYQNRKKKRKTNVNATKVPRFFLPKAREIYVFFKDFFTILRGFLFPRSLSTTRTWFGAKIEKKVLMQPRSPEPGFSPKTWEIYDLFTIFLRFS